MRIPSLYLVEDGFLYLGAIPDNNCHQHYALQLTVTLGQELQLQTADQALAAKGVFIPSQVPHTLLCPSPVVLLLVFPTSNLGYYYQQKYSAANQELSHKLTQSLLELGQQYYNKKRTAVEVHTAYQHWRQNNLPKNWLPQKVDERIQQLLSWLQKELDAPIPAAQAAQQVHLSTSRFLHLFRKETGITYRRMQLWMKLVQAYKNLEEAPTLTALAHRAGFADSAHFSRTFKETFGLSPSLLSRHTKETVEL